MSRSASSRFLNRKISPLRRRAAQRIPKKKFYIFCEGKNTEPSYFKALQRRLCRSSSVLLEIKGACGVPRSVVEAAVEKKKLVKSGNRNSFESKDEFWAVFDRDLHPCYAEAVNLAQGNSIGLALSNPCFELWLILHLQDYARPDGHTVTQSFFASIHAPYDPHNGKVADNEILINTVEAAERRGQRLIDQFGSNTFLQPPVTTVGNLTKRISEEVTLHQ